MKKHLDFLKRLTNVPKPILDGNPEEEGLKKLEHKLRIFSGDIYTCEMMLAQYWSERTAVL